MVEFKGMSSHFADAETRGRSLNLVDVVVGLSEAMDLVSPVVMNHHKRVACMAVALGGEWGLEPERLQDVWLAALLHDCGVVSLQERLETFRFDFPYPQAHAEAGYRLVRPFAPLKRAARVIRHHHAVWSQEGERVPVEAYLLHLADRADVLAAPGKGIGRQAGSIRATLKRHRGTLFHPGLTDALLDLSRDSSFWARPRRGDPDPARGMARRIVPIPVREGDVEGIAELFSGIIDFRSRYTFSHSRGVAAVAEHLGRLAGLEASDCRRMKVAGLLHDLGKLCVPSEILEKPGPLTEEERAVVRNHPHMTRQILEKSGEALGFVHWAAEHHERLHGGGYPHGKEQRELSEPSRLLAVSDVYTAVTEDRPYRPGMDRSDAQDLLRDLRNAGALDRRGVDLVLYHFPRIQQTRIRAQREAARQYKTVEEARRARMKEPPGPED